MGNTVRTYLLVHVLFAVTTLTTHWVAPAHLQAAEFDESFAHWPVDFRINGKIIFGNQLEETDRITAFFVQASGGDDAKIVGIAPGKSSAEAQDAFREQLDVPATGTWSYLDAASTPLAAEAIASLQAATGVVLIADKKLSASDRQAMLAMRVHLLEVVQRGGVVCALGPIAKLLSRIEITAGEQLAEVAAGLNLVPDSVIETNFTTEADQLRVKSVLASHPNTVAIGLEPNTVMVLDGRILRVWREGRATVMVTANEREPYRKQTIAERREGRSSPNDYLIDLTQWRRIAIERTLEPFPPANPRTPHVAKGTLVIVGGGGMPKGLMTQFIEFAGGHEKARLVYVPCSERESLAAPQRTVESWKEMGVQHATFIHTKDRHQANDDEDFLAPLKEATGIWFGGGRQWNFADSYYGTTAHKLMKEVLNRGGVIGGSSAGASIQARYLARATPISNYDIMAPGYERGGLGFISGVAIDQHFSQRGRQKDMTQLVNRYPQMLGIGLDEATAIIVRQSRAEVVGRGKAHFYDRRLPVYPDQLDFVALPAGSTYDLATRTIIEDATSNEPPTDEPPTDEKPSDESPPDDKKPDEKLPGKEPIE